MSTTTCQPRAPTHPCSRACACLLRRTSYDMRTHTRFVKHVVCCFGHSLLRLCSVLCVSVQRALCVRRSGGALSTHTLCVAPSYAIALKYPQALVPLSKSSPPRYAHHYMYSHKQKTHFASTIRLTSHLGTRHARAHKVTRQDEVTSAPSAEASNVKTRSPSNTDDNADPEGHAS